MVSWFVLLWAAGLIFVTILADAIIEKSTLKGY